MSFEEFVDKILEYESDTFTSSGEGLTLEQAQEIAKILLKNRLVGMAGEDVKRLQKFF